MSATGLQEPEAIPAQVVASPRRQGVSWRITWHFISEILKTSIFVLLILELAYSLLVAVGAAQALQLDLLVVLPVVGYAALAMLNDSLPLALIFGTSLVYGRFIADREVMALKSFGLSYRKLLLPALLLGLVAAALGFWINGWLGPAMYHKRSDKNGLIAQQFRYLGEGVDREFSFKGMPWSMWVSRYRGTRLQGVFLHAKSTAKQGLILPLDRDKSKGDAEKPATAQPAMDAAPTEYLWADSANIWFRDELEEQGIDTTRIDPQTLENAVFFVELRDIDYYALDARLSFIRKNGSRSFLQHCRLSSYLHAHLSSGSTKRRKALVTGELLDRIADYRAISEDESVSDAERAGHAEEVVQLRSEFHARWARTSICFLFPVLAALIAIWINSDNRLVPFFVASTLLPGIYFGLAAIAQVLALEGVSPALITYAAPFLLAVVSAVFLCLLERRVLR